MIRGTDAVLAPSPSVATRPPAASQFAAYPASWYLFGESRQLDRGPVSKRIAGRDLVAFRTAGGTLSVMQARCSHLGSDLSRGCVVGETIRCPFHHWEYNAQGRCTHIPAAEEIPAFARQVTYPALERHGLVFFFNGAEPTFELPFFFDERPGDFVRGKPFSFVANCTWYMLAAHGFDTQHFESVHARKLSGPPQIDRPHALALRNRYTADVVGASIFDRLLRPFAGRSVDISITTWGGTLILITGAFARARSYFLIATQPTDDERTLCEVVVFRRRPAGLLGRMLSPLDLWVRRLFTRGYMVEEIQQLGNPRYSPGTLIESDSDMIDYFHWAAALR